MQGACPSSHNSNNISVSSHQEKRANRPLSPRRQERERRRRAAWLERRESRQQPGPLTTSTPATARVNVSGAAGDLPAATAATSATLQSAESSQGKQPTSTAKVKRPKPPSEGTANHSAQRCWRKRRTRGQKACGMMTPSKSGTSTAVGSVGRLSETSRFPR